MNDTPVTRPSLLVRVQDRHDRQAWAEFVEICTPLVYRLCRKYGLQDEDAADVAQDVLLGVAAKIPQFEYDRRRGSFRSWLLTISRRRLCDFFNTRQRHPQGSGKTAVHQMLESEPDRQEQSRWDNEVQRRLFDWAAQQVRVEFENSTWQAFWQTAVEAVPAKVVAGRLEMSLGAVYVAKSRVIGRLRLRIEEVANE